MVSSLNKTNGLDDFGVPYDCDLRIPFGTTIFVGDVGYAFTYHDLYNTVSYKYLI